MDTNTPTERDTYTNQNRVYVQALIDLRGYYTPAIDAYADSLVNEFPVPCVKNRAILRAAMLAFIDGWDSGYDDGYEAGHSEGVKVGQGYYGRPLD